MFICYYCFCHRKSVCLIISKFVKAKVNCRSLLWPNNDRCEKGGFCCLAFFCPLALTHWLVIVVDDSFVVLFFHSIFPRHFLFFLLILFFYLTIFLLPRDGIFYCALPLFVVLCCRRRLLRETTVCFGLISKNYFFSFIQNTSVNRPSWKIPFKAQENVKINQFVKRRKIRAKV